MIDCNPKDYHGQEGKRDNCFEIGWTGKNGEGRRGWFDLIWSDLVWFGLGREERRTVLRGKVRVLLKRSGTRKVSDL